MIIFADIYLSTFLYLVSIMDLFKNENGLLARIVGADDRVKFKVITPEWIEERKKRVKDLGQIYEATQRARQLEREYKERYKIEAQNDHETRAFYEYLHENDTAL